MRRLLYLCAIFAATAVCNAVRINMQGSVSLGKDVLETISHYMKMNADVISRRSMASAKDSERIKWTVQSANIGRGMKICSGPLGDFIKDYVILLANAIESIFDGILEDKEKDSKGIVFADHLKPVLQDINDILKISNAKIEKDKETVEWITIVKKISARFQRAAVDFVDERLEGEPQTIQTVKKTLIQKLILAIILVENKFENKLCDKHNICEIDHKCTKGLHKLLEEFDKHPNEKSMDFMKFFSENIPDQLFYFLGTETLHELQVILSDLSYTKDAPAKDVLSSVFKTVDARLKYLKRDSEMSKAYDQQLVHVILSDMDYFYYSKRPSYPFDNFLAAFSSWLNQGGKFSQQMKQVIKDLKKKLADQDHDMVEKLANEVKVFLELTVDPDH